MATRNAPRFLILKRVSGEFVLTTERDLDPGWDFDAKKAAASPDVVRIGIAGGSSAAYNLARRLRRVSPERARRLRVLQNRIAKLQREHVELIGALWGDALTLDASDIVAIAAKRPRSPKGRLAPGWWGEQKARDDRARGQAIRDVKESMEPAFSIVTVREAPVAPLDDWLTGSGKKAVR
jgi:hypothetical protein